MKHLDMTGQPCPIPVMRTRQALQSEKAVVTVVDNAIAVQNLEKMAKGEGLSCTWRALAQDRFEVTLARSGAAQEEVPPLPLVPCVADAGGMTLLLGREGLGAGADELGTMLMKGFVFALTELAQPPACLIFLNGGAKLTTEGASTVPDLRTLEERGVKVYTCGTCANYFGIKDKLAVGEITDMMHIVQLLSSAQRVMSL